MIASQHLKRIDDELLNKAKKYKSACEIKERIISDMRVERKRELSSVRDFYYDVGALAVYRSQVDPPF